MSDILLDTPPANDINSVFNRDVPLDGTYTAPPTPPVETAPVIAPEPAKVTTPPVAKKGVLDKVGTLKKPVEAAPELPLENKVVVPKNDKEDNIKILRERAQRADAAEKERDTIKSEYEKIKPAYETTRQEFEALKAQGLNETERKEFAQLREMNAVEVLRNSKEYADKLQAPIQKRIARINSVATNAKLSPQASSALIDAIDIPDEFQRAKAIRAIVRGEDLEPEDYTELANTAIATATDLNDNWYPKVDEVERKALEVQTAARAREQQQGKEVSTKQEAELKKAHEDVYQQLAENHLKVLFDEPDLVVDGTTLADAMKNPAKASTPQEMAAQEQFAAAFPFLMTMLNKEMSKRFELEKANKIRNGSAPSRTDGATKGQELKDKPLDAKEVFQGAGQNFL